MNNILDVCTFYEVELNKVPEDIKTKLVDVGYDIDETEDNYVLVMSMADIYNLDVPYEAVDYNSGEFDEYLLEDILLDYIGKFPHYLVFASGCRWNGNSGYKFCEDIKETCYRSYEISLEIVNEITGKAIVCRESSHDVPTGHTTIIVGLTEKEYNKLCDADFDKIEQFANKFNK